MLIYKNKDNKRTLNNVNNFLSHQRCIHLTYDQYQNNEHINDNICNIVFESNGIDIKSNIISKLNEVKTKIIAPFRPSGNILIPLPIYVMIAKKIETDPDYNVLTKITQEVNQELNIEISKVAGELDKTSLKKFTFQGKYKIVVYIPNLMNMNGRYSYFPSMDSFSKQNRWMELMVSFYSLYLSVVKNDIDYTADLIAFNGGEDKYYSLSKKRIASDAKKMVKKNIKNYQDDYLYSNSYQSCHDLGCVSDVGEDLEEMIPSYTTDDAQMGRNIKQKTPYYPSKCFQMPDYKKWMIDDSGLDEDSKKKVEDFQKKAIDLIEDRYKKFKKAKEDIQNGKEPKGEYDGPFFAPLIKTAVTEARNDVFSKSGKKGHEYGKIYNNSILKDLAKRYKKYPGVPEITFPIFQLKENDEQFKNLVHYMPWGNILLLQDYVINDGESLQVDDVAFKSFDKSCLVRFDNAGFLSIYKNNGNIYKKTGIVSGAENINMKKYTNRTLKYEVGSLNMYGNENNTDNNDNRGSIVFNITDNNVKMPLSIILTNEGKIITYDLGLNRVS